MAGLRNNPGGGSVSSVVTRSRLSQPLSGHPRYRGRMRTLQGTGWLLVGAVLALVVPATGAHEVLVGLLRRMVPLPWAGILLGALLFGAFAGLYFRAHWATAARAARESAQRNADVAERLAAIGDEIERAGFLIGDNLREVDAAGGSRRDMFLAGARAHAERLPTMARRCRGLASRLLPASRMGGADDDEGAGEPEER